MENTQQDITNSDEMENLFLFGIFKTLMGLKVVEHEHKELAYMLLGATLQEVEVSPGLMAFFSIALKEMDATESDIAMAEDFLSYMDGLLQEVEPKARENVVRLKEAVTKITASAFGVEA